MSDKKVELINHGDSIKKAIHMSSNVKFPVIPDMKLSMKLSELTEGFRILNKSIAEVIRKTFEIHHQQILSMLETLQQTMKDIASINLSEFYTSLAEDCKKNAKFGWCLSAEMTIPTYREIAREKDDQATKDALFLKYFEANDMELYKYEKKFILASSEGAWVEFYDECFYMFENEKYKIAIPALMTAIEKELSAILNSFEIGRRLVERAQEFNEELREKDKFTYAVFSSVVELLQTGIFLPHNFAEERKELINRNWVLHGRDDPSNWSKVDVYRLMTIISALKLLRIGDQENP